MIGRTLGWLLNYKDFPLLSNADDAKRSDCVTITGLFVSEGCSGPDESRTPGPRTLVGIECCR
jgi:hypothetical protein